MRLKGASQGLDDDSSPRHTGPLTAGPPTLSAELAALFSTGDDADVALRCGGEDLRAHKLLLCVRSPVLAARIRRPLSAGLKGDTIDVPEFIKPAIMRRVNDIYLHG